MTALQRLSAINIHVSSSYDYDTPITTILHIDNMNEIMQISKLSVFDAYRLRHTHHKQSWCSVLTLQITDKEANLPLSSNVQTLKCCQLKGVSPPPPDQGLCLLTPLGALPPDPRYRLALTINVSTCAVQNFP